MTQMEKRVADTIHVHGMLAAGDTVIVALSGGADSVALFHALLALREGLGIHLAAAHFNHGLRGEEADRDAAFAQELCACKGVMLYTENAEMNAKPRPKGESVEAWARMLRYAFFEGLAAAHKAKIATAHTLNDNAETVLFHAIRGSGPRGLAGIPPVRGHFIRPLLDVSREEVEAYCAEHGLAFVHDSTNADEAYARNRLRHNVLPQLEQAHPGAKRALGRLAADMRALDDWLAAEAGKLLAAAGEGGKNSLPYAKGYHAVVLLAAPQPVRLKALALLAGKEADRACLARLEQVLGGALGAAQLPGGRVARLRRGCLVLERAVAQPPISYEIPLAEGEIALPGGWRLAVRVQKLPGNHMETKKSGQKALPPAADYDKMNQYGVFRGRRPKDLFAACGRGVTKPLRKWMNEEGIPPALRPGWPLLAAGSRVLWVLGGGFAEGLAPDETTRRVVTITPLAGPVGAAFIKEEK